MGGKAYLNGDSREKSNVGGGRHDDQLQVPELVEGVSQDRQQEVGEAVALVYLSTK